MFKPITIIAGVFLLGLTGIIGAWVYFVSGISATYPPIREYDYPKSFSRFKKSMDQLVLTDKKLSYKITAANGSNHYLTLKLTTDSNDFEYNIVYRKTDYWIKKDITEIGLVGAFDKNKIIGGYHYKDRGVKRLVEVFEKEFIDRLSKN
jgi:hypothetical protein